MNILSLDSTYLKCHRNVLLANTPSLGKMIVLTCDGMTNLAHRSVFNIMICTPLPYFFASFRLMGEEESANKLFTKLSQARAQLEQELRAHSAPTNNNARPANEGAG